MLSETRRHAHHPLTHFNKLFCHVPAFCASHKKSSKVVQHTRHHNSKRENAKSGPSTNHASRSSQHNSCLHVNIITIILFFLSFSFFFYSLSLYCSPSKQWTSEVFSSGVVVHLMSRVFCIVYDFCCFSSTTGEKCNNAMYGERGERFTTWKMVCDMYTNYCMRQTHAVCARVNYEKQHKSDPPIWMDYFTNLCWIRIWLQSST